MIIVGDETKDKFCERLAKEISKLNGSEEADFFPLEHTHYSDKESKPRLTDGRIAPQEMFKDPQDLIHRIRHGEKVVSVSRGKSGEDWDPNGVFVDAIFVAGAIRDECPDANICAVLPYHPYSRQHDQSLPGEPISAKYVTQILKWDKNFANMVITVSAHQKRSEGQIDNRVWNMDGTESAIEHARELELLKERYLVTPDSGQYSGKLRFPFAEALDAGTIALGKERSRVKEIVTVDERKLDDLKDPENTTLLLYDDEMSTGDTGYNQINMCIGYGIKPENIKFIAIHNKDCLNKEFDKRAVELIEGIGAYFAASDTIESPASKFTVVPQLAKYIMKRFG